MSAVFSRNADLLAAPEVGRVTGAVKAEIVSGERNIPESFPVGDAVVVTVPKGATHLFVCTYDEYYNDNSDADNNCAVRITNLTPHEVKVVIPKDKPPAPVVSKKVIASTVVVAPKVATHPRPGLLIKKNSEPVKAYALSDSYQVIPSGSQIEMQTVKSMMKATYQVRVQNNGTGSSRFVVRTSGVGMGNSGARGWTVTYKNGSNAKINSALLSGQGYQTGVLAPGAGETITIEMTPGKTVWSGATRRVTLRVFQNSADTKVRDAVQAVTTLQVPETGDFYSK